MELVSVNESTAPEGGYIVEIKKPNGDIMPFHWFDGYKSGLSDKVKAAIDEWQSDGKTIKKKDKVKADEKKKRDEEIAARDQVIADIQAEKDQKKADLIDALSNGDWSAAADILIK